MSDPEQVSIDQILENDSEDELVSPDLCMFARGRFLLRFRWFEDVSDQSSQYPDIFIANGAQDSFKNLGSIHRH